VITDDLTIKIEERIARAAARATQPKAKMWTVRWRGRITRDVGTDHERALTASEARILFQDRYPMREIVAITQSE
jgi:hypothetical protein